ncbi:hypothetical protein STEG23_002462, partial [Scotinomys teguina]
MVTGCDLDSGHLCGLWWLHGPPDINTDPRYGRNNDPDMILSSNLGLDVTMAPVSECLKTSSDTEKPFNNKYDLRLTGLDNAMNSSCPITSKIHTIKSSALCPKQAHTSYCQSRSFRLNAGIVWVQSKLLQTFSVYKECQLYLTSNPIFQNPL